METRRSDQAKAHSANPLVGVLALSALWVLGCEAFPQTPYMVTECGMQVIDASDAGMNPNAHDLQVIERRAVAQGLITCEQLSTWVLQPVPVATPEGSIPTRWGDCYGFTQCDTRGMGVAFYEGKVFGSALAHEMLHAGQCPATNYSHEGWNVKDTDTGLSPNDRIAKVNEYAGVDLLAP